MARIRIDDLPDAWKLTPEEMERILGAGRRSYRPGFDALEVRELFAANLNMAVMNQAAALATPRTGSDHVLPLSRKVHSVASSTVSLAASGEVTVTTADGSKVYQSVANGWKLIAWNYQTPQGWVEERWDAGGKYEKDVWIGKFHTPLGRTSRTVIANGVMTVTLFHQNNYDAYGYNAFGWYLDYVTKAQDATVTWTYKLRGDVNHRDLVEYRLVNGKGQQDKANAWWAKNPPSTPYFDPAYHGWFESFPGRNNVPPPDVPDSAVAALHPHVEVFKEPPGAAVEPQSRGGDRIETVWNTGRTEAISVVYGGPAHQTLIEQIYGRTVGGKWVTVTDHSKAFVTQTATYEERGGKLETSTTVRKVADGAMVTFKGTWTSGTNVASATGVETASNDLGFQSVTIRYQNGKPVTRHGLLEPSLGGGYATDTFDDAGTSVITREISTTQGGPVVETWRGSNGDLTISRNNPSAEIRHDEFHYQWNAPNAYSTDYTLLKYNATLVKPVEYHFDGATKSQTSTQYHWKAFFDRGEWHYREGGATAGYIASAFPDPRVSMQDPRLDNYWNKL
jgi:hypothetical protein